MKKMYYWLFSKEERIPIDFIVSFFMTIVISVGVCLFILGMYNAYVIEKLI